MKQKIKALFRVFFPKRIRVLRSLYVAYAYDLKRYSSYGNSTVTYETQNKICGVLTYTYHNIEKGLTMPNGRLGFGVDKIETIIKLCQTYMANGFDTSALPFIHAIRVLNEYVKHHQDRDYNLDAQLINKIKDLSIMANVLEPSSQKQFSKESFFTERLSSFDKFCLSRHSVRNFSSKDIPLEIFYKCVDLAQASPSACNRQPNRIYIVKNKKMMADILSLQNGNRGFGHLANAIIVFASDLSVFRGNGERHEMYLNSGMYAMTFTYALHRYEIGACALNWSVSPEKDKKINKILNLPQNELVTLTLACGYVPDQFGVADSPKLDSQLVTTVYQ